MKASASKGQLYRSLHALSIVPLLVLGLTLALFSYHTVRKTMIADVQVELKNTVNSLILTYDLMYPGDYHLEGVDQYVLLKGTQPLNGDFDIIDRVKADTGAEITIFYQDTRVLTTICDSAGSRIIGTGSNTIIVRDVIVEKQPHFYTNTEIDGIPYFAYYAPLFNSDGSVAGMAYAGKPCSIVNKTVMSVVLPVLFIALISICVASVIVSSYTNKLLGALQKIRTFLSKVSTGNLAAELDSGVLQRGDELSEMAYSALYMQRSLRTLVEQDTLTELNNRRFADKHLRQTQIYANTHGTGYVVAIGDIDFFKSVNDTYGHECGDLVLKKIAGLLKKNMLGKGFVARWGGEEFLFVYDNCTLSAARADMELLLDEIRSLPISYDDQEIRISMTFGLAEGGIGTNVKDLLQLADTHLYAGKSNGRNQIVWE